MKLQRYEAHIYASLLGESRILFEASDTGDWVKADEALAEIARLRAALEIIGGVSNNTCESIDTLSMLSREFIRLARLELEK